MAKQQHEFCDPIHAFVRADSEERKVIDSSPVQRLRHINQLATTFLVYPGATHRRFEHSLGTMELAGRVYDVVTDMSAMTNDVRERIESDVDLRHNTRSCSTGGVWSDLRLFATTSVICPSLTQPNMTCSRPIGITSGYRDSSYSR